MQIEVSGNEEKENAYLSALVRSQPDENRALLGALLGFLKVALLRSAENGLTRDILSSFYGRYLISPSDLAYKRTAPQPLQRPLEL